MPMIHLMHEITTVTVGNDVRYTASTQVHTSMFPFRTMHLLGSPTPQVKFMEEGPLW
ncbi:hypothetical protein K443DRAFT_675915 [Laccaria amethystina LaAM-08-1]|uniref:Unplaced genomic scaffold K443scaffold_34, whole genome shotgun sequence n=1 Tax=Laccaria amethystina LaAM-08-1 TaxID=1095629 RepID=A0A0C9X5K6_9AGAR|nr:hypothetical protein K443DRAFT_682254 [Laccaria amethystina LaAM-08-1]KIK04449.1 hypothetical protein K443DRAFT_675915 [Laccaria amethystina LaAM-08-1]